jgi:hypothetical protein
MTHELEARVHVQVLDVSFASGEQVVGANNLMALRQKAVY